MAGAGEEGANGSFHRQESRACGGSLGAPGERNGCKGPTWKGTHSAVTRAPCREDSRWGTHLCTQVSLIQMLLLGKT